MKCVVCKKGETKAGTTTMTLEKDGATLVFKSVPEKRVEIQASTPNLTVT